MAAEAVEHRPSRGVSTLVFGFLSIAVAVLAAFSAAVLIAPVGQHVGRGPAFLAWASLGVAVAGAYAFSYVMGRRRL